MAEVMSMVPDESPAGELNTEEQDSLQVGEELEQQQDQRLAGKYKNAEELEAAYLELQKKLGQQDNEAEAVESSDEPEEDTSNESLLDQLWEQAKENNYNEETLEQLSKSDPNDIARMYLEYRNKLESEAPVRMTEKDADDLRGIVGGEEKYNEMLGWASQNLSDKEIEMYDSIMETGDPNAAYFAVQALSYRYQDSNGVEGNLIQGKSPSRSNDSFRSQAELVKAMSDPRYDKDPAYRNDVMRKLSNSDVSF